MVQLVRPNLLGSKVEFNARFVNPIQNGQYSNSTSEDVKLMKERTQMLHDILDGFVQVSSSCRSALAYTNSLL